MAARSAICVCALSSVLCMSAVARADVMDITSFSPGSTEGIGAFTGTVEYVGQTATTGLLTVSLTNTSPAGGGGFITGFAVRIGSVDTSASATLSSASHPFLNLGQASAPPFGMFDAGAALGGDWTGGGSPQQGIAVGQTGTFTFSVSASDAGSLGAASFVTDGEPYGLVVRLRGFQGGGSDKVPGIPVPAPAAAGALGLGGVMLGSRRRRR